MTTKVYFEPVLRDLCFKYLFGYQKNVKYTEYLLESLFDLNPGYLRNKIKIINSFTLEKINYQDRGLEADVIVEMPDGKIINLEAYTTFYTSSKIKSFMYLGHLFSSQLNMGENVSTVKPHMQINFVKGINIKSRKYVVLSEEEPRDLFIGNMFEIYVINVAEHEKISYNKNENLKRILRFMSAEDQEEMEMAVRGDKMLESAYRKLERFVLNKWRQDFFSVENYNKWVATEIAETRGKESLEQGLEQGSNEKALEIAKNLLNENVSINIIMKTTGLSKEQIESLKE